jgi:lysozyme
MDIFNVNSIKEMFNRESMKDFKHEVLAAQLLKKDEGFKQHPYFINGVLHIGYGFNLDDMGILLEEADFILANRIRMVEDEVVSNVGYYPTLSDNRRAILINLCFSMGISKLMEIRKFHDAILQKNWSRAAKELMDSESTKYNHSRMERLAYCFEVDKL